MYIYSAQEKTTTELVAQSQMKTMKFLYCYVFVLCCITAFATCEIDLETCNITSSVFQPDKAIPEVQQLLKHEILRQRYLGEFPQSAATSYKELKEIKPCLASSGFWIETKNGLSKKIANVDMEADTQCPPGLQMVVNSTKRLCRSPQHDGGCSSVNFSVGGAIYNKVYGRVIGYQYYSTCAFGQGSVRTIDGAYVDGVSITHGLNPRNHIWTFAVGYDELTNGSPNAHCPCVQPAASARVPAFVGRDYYCDTGSHTAYTNHLYIDNAVWDGQGCGPTSTCCDDSNLPWFTNELQRVTSDNIELRICRNSNRDNEDILLEIIEIYIQLSTSIRQVANINMQVHTKCPEGLEIHVESGKQFCRRPGGTTAGSGCNSVTFSVNRNSYSKVWGKVIGYQYGVIDGFAPGRTLDGTSPPVDGITITHGQNPRKHIWTYAVGNSEVGTSTSQCPCTHPSAASQVPSFVGSDYYCDTGSRNNPTRQLYRDNPLWDGQGCGPTSTCCDDPDLPWFIKELGQTTNEDIEFRVCNDGSDEYLAIEVIEIYVQ